MSNLDKILRRRLEKIREELDSYIDARLVITDRKLSETSPERVPEEK